jgi:RNA polymerase sigma-70 factor (ECF subfamily)
LEGNAETPRSDAAFHTTRWSIILAAGRVGGADSREALESLCHTYWPPIHAFVRRTGVRSDEARDLTQGFFARLLERQAIAEARQARGKFRTFLLAALVNYLADERDHARALKRGGGRLPLSLDGRDAEASAALDVGHDDTPERAFERRWAHTLLDRCWERLREELQRAPYPARALRLQRLLSGESTDGYREAAQELGVGESAVRVAVHRLRRRFAAILREEVAHTVQDRADVEGELQYLMSVLRS